MRSAALHRDSESGFPQREPRIPLMRVPGRSPLVGIVHGIEDTGLDK
jgi:hypothetical protein